jgi:hypothetical protein
VDHAAIKRLIEKRRVATIELLTEADFQDLEPLLLLLKRLRPIEEVSTALMERMAITPVLYFRHFAVRVQ